MEEVSNSFKSVSCQVRTALEKNRRLVAGAACLPVPDELLVS
jgi:hypothetical protein